MLIENGTIYYHEQFTNHLSVHVQDGVITGVGENLCPRADEERLNLNGDYLIPGFVDVHIHAYMGSDTMQGEQAVRAMSRELRKAGVAAFCPTTMSATPSATRSALQGIHAVMENPEPSGAAVLGAHMEAPFLNPKKAGAQLSECLCVPSPESWAQYTGDYEAAVRTVTLAPELPGAEEMIRFLTAKGIPVSLGHTAAAAEQVHRAAELGATRVTHTFNAQTPFSHREPGVPGAALCDDRLACEFISDGIHLHPDTVRVIIRCKGASRAVAITDAMEAAGMPDGQYSLGGQAVFVKNGAARLENGTLAGSTLTMYRALRNLISFGIAPEDAVRMTTRTPAELIGAKGFGVIEPGAAAAFVRLKPDFGFAGAV